MSGHLHPDELSEYDSHLVKLCSTTICRYCREETEARMRQKAVDEVYRLLDEATRQIDYARQLLKKVL